MYCTANLKSQLPKLVSHKYILVVPGIHSENCSWAALHKTIPLCLHYASLKVQKETTKVLFFLHSSFTCYLMKVESEKLKENHFSLPTVEFLFQSFLI